VSFRGGGGGGYGSPLERSPDAVLADVLSGYVSSKKAEEEYGVVLDPSGRRVDEKKTAALRTQLQTAEGRGQPT